MIGADKTLMEKEIRRAVQIQKSLGEKNLKPRWKYKVEYILFINYFSLF
jgi:hypothetical protein